MQQGLKVSLNCPSDFMCGHNSNAGDYVNCYTNVNWFGGMLIEPFTTFIVPTLYRAYMEFKMRAGLHDDFWEGTEDGDVSDHAREAVVSAAA